MAAAPTPPPMREVHAAALGRGGAEQYGPKRHEEAHLSAVRPRLSPDEAALVRYVLAEWSGEAGCRSSFGAMSDRLVQFSVTGVPASPMTDAEVIYCHTEGGGLRADHLFPQEAWSNDRRTRWGEPSRQSVRRADILRTYRALCCLHRPDVVVLQVLYGDRPPWVPAGNLPLLWAKEVNRDYWRVAPLCPSYGTGIGPRIDRKLVSALQRAQVLLEVGAECERAIAVATRAYWAAS